MRQQILDIPTYEDYERLNSKLDSLLTYVQIIAQNDDVLITISQAAEIAGRVPKWVHDQIDAGNLKLEPTDGVKKMKRSVFLDFFAKYKRGEFKNKR